MPKAKETRVHTSARNSQIEWTGKGLRNIDAIPEGKIKTASERLEAKREGKTICLNKVKGIKAFCEVDPRGFRRQLSGLEVEGVQVSTPDQFNAKRGHRRLSIAIA